MILGSDWITLINGPSFHNFVAQATAVANLSTADIIGTWVAAALTVFIFSFLYEDNPFYKFAEYLFIGVSAGYWIVMIYQNVVIPNLWGKLVTAHNLYLTKHIISWENWSYIIAGIMGIMLVMKLVPKISWIARWPLAFMVGISSGLGIVLTMDAFVINQIEATVVNLIVHKASLGIDWGATIRSWIIVLGVCSSLIYFYFSIEHKGLLFGTVSRFGILVLMIAFGASFGYTVMARVSLLIGRMLFFRDEWWPACQATLRAVGVHV